MDILISIIVLYVLIVLFVRTKNTKHKIKDVYPEGIEYVKRDSLTKKDIQKMALDVLNDDLKETIELSANSIQELKYLISKFEKIPSNDVELLSNGETYLQGQKVNMLWRYSPFGTFEWYRPAISQEEYEMRYFSIMYPDYIYTKYEPNENIEEKSEDKDDKIIQGPW